MIDRLGRKATSVLSRQKYLPALARPGERRDRCVVGSTYSPAPLRHSSATLFVPPTSRLARHSSNQSDRLVRRHRDFYKPILGIEVPIAERAKDVVNGDT